QLLKGKYHVGSVIGRGGMGLVYEGVHLQTTRRVAIKTLLPELVADADAVSRIRKEAEAAGRLDHPGIAGVIDLDDEKGVHFLVMEYVDGESLRRRLRHKGRLEIAETVRLGTEIARILSVTHAKGVVHRDLKPDNIFL